MPHQAFIDAYESPASAAFGMRLELKQPVRLDDTLRELRGVSESPRSPGERAEALVDVIEHSSPSFLVRNPRPAAPHPEEFEDEPVEDEPSMRPQARRRAAGLGPVPAFLRTERQSVIEPARTIPLEAIGGVEVLPNHPSPPPVDTPDAAKEKAANWTAASSNEVGMERPSHETHKPVAGITDTPDCAVPETDEEPGSLSEQDESAAGLLPMYQVDHFAWPKACELFERRAGRQIDRLTEAVEAMVFSGTRYLGFASRRRGEGCTTILAGTARRLAARGRKVVLIDGDLSNPRLADCLGLAVETGWEKAVDRECRLEEVLIESVEDGGLTLLPWCGATLDADGLLLENPLDFAIFKALGQEYDLVLVDLGAISSDTENSAVRSPLFHSDCVDSVVIIQDVRNTSREEVLQMKETMETAGIRPAGLAENFAVV